MTRSIFNRLRDAAKVLNGTIDVDSAVMITGKIRAQVIRDGQVIKDIERNNVVTYYGLNRIAYRMANYTNTIAQYLVLGTVNVPNSLGSGQANIGEISRKIAITMSQSHEYFTGVATWAGNADGLTGITFDSAGLSDYVNSSATTGILMNVTNGLGITLQASDFLNLTISIRCGSHNIAQST